MTAVLSNGISCMKHLDVRSKTSIFIRVFFKKGSFKPSLTHKILYFIILVEHIFSLVAVQRSQMTEKQTLSLSVVGLLRQLLKVLVGNPNFSKIL